MAKIILNAVVVDRFLLVRHRWQYNYLAFCAFGLFSVVYLRFMFGPNFVFSKWDWKDDISCYLDGGDNLSRATELNPSGRSIFFNDASCNVRHFDPKDACCIESAARAHSTWSIYVLFNRPVSDEELKRNDVLNVLLSLPNVKFARVNIEEYSMGTPAEGFVSSGALNDTECPIALTEGLVKYLSLYKWGGIFMEKDVIVTKSFSSLPRNWVPKSNEQNIGSGILALSQDGRAVAEAALRLLIKHHKSMDCNDGENVMEKIVEQECSTPSPLTNTGIVCNGFEIYGPQFFYPIESQRVAQYSATGQLPEYEAAYTYYLWTKLGIGVGIRRRSGSRYNKLVRKHCPAIYDAFRF